MSSPTSSAASSPVSSAASSPATTAEARSPLRGITAEGTHHDAFEARDWLLLFAAAAIWGSSFLSIAVGVEYFGPGLVTFGRIALGALALGCTKRARRTRIERGDWPRIVVVAVTWLAFPMTLFPIAQQHIASGLAGMLNGSIPLFTAVVASLALRRLPGRWQLAGLVVGAVGIVVLGWPTLRGGGSSAFGVVLVVVACASYGLAASLSVPLAQRYGSIPVFWRCQLVACAFTWPLALREVGNAEWRVGAAVAMLSLGVLGTAVAFLAMIDLGARVGSTRAASLTYLEAILALGIGVAFRNEAVGPWELVGSAVLLAGAWLVSRSDRS